MSAHFCFEPAHDAEALVRADHAALAAQLSLCRSARQGWCRVLFLSEAAQAFAARRALSLALLLGCTALWAGQMMG